MKDVLKMLVKIGALLGPVIVNDSLSTLGDASKNQKMLTT